MNHLATTQANIHPGTSNADGTPQTLTPVSTVVPRTLAEMVLDSAARFSGIALQFLRNAQPAY